MIQSGASENRHTIPRWNESQVANALGETSSFHVKKDGVFQDVAAGQEQLHTLIHEWELEKNLPLAVEIISESLLVENELNIDHIRQYVLHQISQMDYVPDLLKEVVGIEDRVDLAAEMQMGLVTRRQISKLKRSLIEAPRNPLKWSELARNYLILGQNEQSEKALSIARQLAPNHRSVLRATAAFYAHTGDCEKGLSYLRKSPLVRYDPWVLSAEIALANQFEYTSRLVKLGQQMLDDKNINPAALSELAGELGTMDFKAANSRKGRKKLEIAKIVPHENAVAQMTWINQNLCKIDHLIDDIIKPKYNFEAEAMVSYLEKDWAHAVDIVEDWQKYQPFSRDPAMMGSFVATDYLNNPERAIRILEMGRQSNPEDLNIENNYAYALIMNGKLAEGQKCLDRAFALMPTGTALILLTATQGLYFFRAGEYQGGRKLYQRAIEMAKAQKQPDLGLRATIYLAREEKLIGENISGYLNAIKREQGQEYYREQQGLLSKFGLDEDDNIQ